MTLLPEYRTQLYQAAERRSRPRAARLTRLLPVAASTVIVIGVAVAAVAMLSHHGKPSSVPVLTHPGAPAGPLGDMLGVMRRPQTEADRETWVPGFFMTFASPACHTASTPLRCTLRLDRPLIRQVIVPGSGYQVGLLPYTSAGKVAGVAVTLRGPGID